MTLDIPWEGLREASDRLAELEDDALLDALDAAIASWRDAGGLAAETARALGEVSGKNSAMLEFALLRSARSQSRCGMRTGLEAGRREAPGSRLGPRVVLQVLAGNVTGLALPAMVECLLARSAVVLKPASGDPVSPVQLAGSVLSQNIFNGAIHIATWTGGNETVESEVFARSSYIIASGGEEAMQSIAARRGGNTLLHGPRVSVGILVDAMLSPEDARHVAREIALHDQHGCLSPRIVFSSDPQRSAHALGQAMAYWQERWPIGPGLPGEAYGVYAVRARAAVDPEAGLVAPRGLDWTVVWDNREDLDVGPPRRVVRVARFDNAENLARRLQAAAGKLQGVGVLGSAGDVAAWRDRLPGIAWVGPLQSIQDPPAGWRADGRSGLAELLRVGRG